MNKKTNNKTNNKKNKNIPFEDLPNVLSLKRKKTGENFERYNYYDRCLNNYYNDFYNSVKKYEEFEFDNGCFINRLFMFSLFTFNIDNSKLLKTDKSAIDIILSTYNEFLELYYNLNFNEKSFKDKKLVESMNYAFLGGGKRIRAFLIFLVSYLYMPDYYQFYYVNLFSLCIELIHSFSLVHDDLPSIDNDEIRRYKPSTWKKYGEATALLTGDALLNQSYSFLHYVFNNACNVKMEFIGNLLNNYDQNKYSLVMNEVDELRRLGMAAFLLSDATGIDGMISGELDDTVINPKKLDIDKIKDIYYKKTTKLIEVAMIIPSILVPTNKKIVSIINKIANKLGFAYQLVDDLLEYTSTTEQIGKSVDSDKKNNKITYVSLVGLDNAKAELANIRKYILHKCKELEKFDELDFKRVRFFKKFMLYIIDRDK